MFKTLFLLSLLSFSLYADQTEKRPTIGLVLSGGGARGAAHLGVLQVFEKHNIPVDFIVGTSIGSLVGALYASGHSTDEIEALMITTPWDKYIVPTDPRQEIPFRRKTLNRDFPGQLKAGINGNNNTVFAPGLFKKQMMLQFINRQFQNVIYERNFDKLPIPFRSVATDISTGEAVVMGSGILTQAVYASLAIPGGFEPIEIDGKTLIDGGLSQNLPIDAMRELGPDIIVVIDISTPFNKDAEFDSYEDVLGQLTNILMRKNVEDVIKTMGSNEILITPNLEGYTPLDTSKYEEMIKIGYDKTSSEYEKKLSHLSVSDEVYKAYKKSLNTVTPINPVIEQIIIHNDSYVNNDFISERIHQPLNKALDYALLEKDLMNIYSTMIFSEASYRITRIESKTTLVILTKPSWNAHGEVRFGFGFQDDFQGHSDYTVRLEYNKFGLNSYGGEWRTRFEMGQTRMILTELYQPLDKMQRTFFRTDVYNKIEKVYVSPKMLGNHDIVLADDSVSIPIHTHDYGGHIALGVNVWTSLQAEFGISAKTVQPSLDILVVDGSGKTSFVTTTDKQNIVEGYANMTLDSLDNAFFPTKGFLGKITYKQNTQFLGSEMDYAQGSFGLAGAFGDDTHTVIPHIRVGTTTNIDNFEDSADLSAYYDLGGLFSLSGRPTYSATGEHMAFMGGVYRYKITGTEYFNALQLYTGFSLETGSAWYGRREDFSRDDILYGSSVYLAADTFLGPFYLAYGYSDHNNQTVYFSLGIKR